MDRVLELLVSEKPEDFKVAVEILTPDLLEGSADQLKHKLKVRVSALLKSTGPTRAYGAILARRILIDWSAVKSHGSSWAVILLHVLDLPDVVCWRPATKTLSYLFARVHGKADLAREIAGSKIGDFMKRLVNTLDTTKSYAAAVEMLRLYPAQCRPYLNKLEPIVRNKDSLALASLCLSEKQGVEVWTSRVNECLDKLSQHASSLSEREFQYTLDNLVAYIRVAPLIAAKVPAKRLADVLILLLGLLKPIPVVAACDFIYNTYDALEPLYTQQFDFFAYKLNDCIDMGLQEAVRAFAVLQRLVSSVRWVSENYARLFTRLVRKALTVWEKEETIIGAQGLADYVQVPNAFKSHSLTSTQRRTIIKFLSTVILHVPGVPQSSRGKVDKVVLAHGTHEDIIQATLYPGKYSILPLALEKNPELRGFETLVHPRFPPLRISKRLLEDEQNKESEPTADTYKPKFDGTQGQTDEKNELEIINEEINVGDIDEARQVSEAELPAIPESMKPTSSIATEGRPLNSAMPPPEKRARTDQLIIQASEEPERAEERMEDDEEEEEELIIPTLTMDSD